MLWIKEQEFLTSQDDTAKSQHLVLLGQGPVRLLRQKVLSQKIDQRSIKQQTRRAINRQFNSIPPL